MINSLRDKFKGNNMAILGSDPSVSLYEEKEDIAIALNGAALLDKDYNLFLTGDTAAPKREWWLSSGDKNLVTRLVSSYIAPFDPFLYPNEIVRGFLQDELDETIRLNQDKKYPYTSYIPSVKPSDGHFYFKFGGKGKEFVDNISPEQKEFFWGGTISAIALQISLVMGFKEINLYGCGFNNFEGSNYFYNCSEDQKGKIKLDQIEIMQLTVDKIRTFGVEVNIIGESKIH